MEQKTVYSLEQSLYEKTYIRLPQLKKPQNIGAFLLQGYVIIIVRPFDKLRAGTFDGLKINIYDTT